MIDPCETCTRGGDLKEIAGKLTMRVAVQNVDSGKAIDLIAFYNASADDEYGPVPVEFIDKVVDESTKSDEIREDLFNGIQQTEMITCDPHEPNVCPKLDVLNKMEKIIFSKTAHLDIHLGPHELDF
jgi:hypothetical protein